MELKVGDVFFDELGRRVTILERYPDSSYKAEYQTAYYVRGSNGRLFWGEGPLAGQIADNRPVGSTSRLPIDLIVFESGSVQLDLFD